MNFNLLMLAEKLADELRTKLPVSLHDVERNEVTRVLYVKLRAMEREKQLQF